MGSIDLLQTLRSADSAGSTVERGTRPPKSTFVLSRLVPEKENKLVLAKDQKLRGSEVGSGVLRQGAN